MLPMSIHKGFDLGLHPNKKSAPEMIQFMQKIVVGLEAFVREAFVSRKTAVIGKTCSHTHTLTQSASHTQRIEHPHIC